jgi:hypothetical protein
MTGKKKPKSQPRTSLVYSTDREGVAKILIDRGEDPKKLARLIARNVSTLKEVELLAETWAPLLGLSYEEFMRTVRPGRRFRREGQE